MRFQSYVASAFRRIGFLDGIEPIRLKPEATYEQLPAAASGPILLTNRQPSIVSRSTNMVRLSVNVNKVATVRNSRGGRVPSVLEAVEVCIAAGSPGITVHPRADQRHITPEDVRDLAA